MPRNGGFTGPLAHENLTRRSISSRPIDMAIWWLSRDASGKWRLLSAWIRFFVLIIVKEYVCHLVNKYEQGS
jgi:hypothetical protein